MQNKIPLVSVVIPMFNSAKFIPQTLESLLYQTLKNFEVVVVDDCSTDNSVAVVESYAERFGGRLHVVKLPKNTGTPGLPRNVGIQFARGKYIAFLDSDDLFTKTALEELSTLAEKFQADVVHMNDTVRIYNGKTLTEDDPRLTDFAQLTDPKNFSLSNWHHPMPRPKPVAAPTLTPAAVEKRVKIWLNWQYRWATCTVFCRRDFLIANQIFFTKLLAAEDMFFNFKILCVTEKILHVPNVVYIIRKRFGSVSRDAQTSESAENYFGKWTGVINEGFKIFDDFMEQIPFFKKNPAQRFAVLDFFFGMIVNRHLRGIYLQNPPQLIYPVLKKFFNPDDAPLASYLFNTVNVYRLHLMKLQQELTELKRSR